MGAAFRAIFAFTALVVAAMPAGAAWKQDTTTADVPADLVPAGALHPGQIRRTVVAFTLDEKGIIAGCRVVMPSRNVTLDAASCPLLEGARIAIPPGAPGSMTLAVRWAMPKEPSTSDFGGAIPVDRDRWVRPFDKQVQRALRNQWYGPVTARLTIGANGRLTDCQAVSTDADGSGEGGAPLAKETCSELLDRATFVSARNASGRARETQGSMRVFWCQALTQTACDDAKRLSRQSQTVETP
jgi:hypothetical protein